MTCSQAIEDGLVGEKIAVVWHAGEPLVVGLSSFQLLIDACDPLVRSGAKVTHCLQTNGTLISDATCQFILRNNIQVCVSIDGPRDIHDGARIDRRRRGTFDTVMRGLETLNRHDIPFDVICVLTKESINEPDAIYDFFKSIKPRSLGINIDEHEGSNSGSSFSKCDFEAVELFYHKLFDRHILEKPFILREFDTLLHTVANGAFSAFNQQVLPFGILTISTRGDFTPFSPELLGQSHEMHGSFHAGNVHSGSLVQQFRDWAVHSMVPSAIGRGVAACETTCSLFEICGGGAPSNKITENGTFESTETTYCMLTKKAVYSAFERTCMRALSST